MYLIGAFFVLFSSVFASNAAWSRLFPDIFNQLGWVSFKDTAARKRVIAIFSCIIPLVWALMFFLIHSPVLMILSGGIVGSFMLFLVVYAALYFRKERQPMMPSGILYELAFWVSVASIVSVGVYGLVQIFA
jgi:hypothetical protein